MKQQDAYKGKTSSLVRIALLLALVFGSSLALGAQDLTEDFGTSEAWRNQFRLTYAAMSRGGAFEPSALALKLCLETGKAEWSALPPEEAARSAYRLALRAERNLRFGGSAQETRAMVRQTLRIESRQGEKASLGLEEGSRLMAQVRLRQRLGLQSGRGGAGSKGKQ